MQARRCVHNVNDQMMQSFQASLASSIGKAVTFGVKGFGFNPRWGSGTLSKITKILFLIEDTSELECWTLVKYPKRHSNMSPGESLTARRKVRISWLSSGLRDFPQGSWWLSLGVTKDELECLQGIWDRNCIPRSPQNDSSPPYRKLENGRKKCVCSLELFRKSISFVLKI